MKEGSSIPVWNIPQQFRPSPELQADMDRIEQALMRMPPGEAQELLDKLWHESQMENPYYLEMLRWKDSQI